MSQVLEGVLQHSLLEQVHELLELALRLRVHEVVVVQLADGAGGAFRQVVQTLTVAGGPFLQHAH